MSFRPAPASSSLVRPTSTASTPPQVRLEPGERVYGSFNGRYLFTESRLIETAPKFAAIAWRDIVSAAEKEKGSNQILIVVGRDRTRINIDLTNPTGLRPATRVTQLVKGLAKRWSQEATFGLPLMTIEEFFLKAKRSTDFAVNLQPNLPLSDFKKAFEDVRSWPDVDDLRIVTADAEGEGEVYAQAIVIVTNASVDRFVERLGRLGGCDVVVADENVRRKLRVSGQTQAWVVRWP